MIEPLRDILIKELNDFDTMERPLTDFESGMRYGYKNILDIVYEYIYQESVNESSD